MFYAASDIPCIDDDAEMDETDLFTSMSFRNPNYNLATINHNVKTNCQELMRLSPDFMADEDDDDDEEDEKDNHVGRQKHSHMNNYDYDDDDVDDDDDGDDNYMNSKSNRFLPTRGRLNQRLSKTTKIPLNGGNNSKLYKATDPEADEIAQIMGSSLCSVLDYETCTPPPIRGTNMYSSSPSPSPIATPSLPIDFFSTATSTSRAAAATATATASTTTTTNELQTILKETPTFVTLATQEMSDWDRDEEDDDVEEEMTCQRNKSTLNNNSNGNNTSNNSISQQSRCINSPCSVDSGIQSQPTSNYDLASDVDVRRGPGTSNNIDQDCQTSTPLPPGWQQHDDNQGPYYWHVPTGSVQRSPPSTKFTDSLLKLHNHQTKSTCSNDVDGDDVDYNNGCGCDGNNVVDKKINQIERMELKMKQCNENGDEKFGSSFTCCYLGNTIISEESVTPDQSARTITRCIKLVSSPHFDIHESLYKWSNTKDVNLHIGDVDLTLKFLVNGEVFLRQPILGIKVWGISPSNQNDFAFVVKDQQIPGKFLCHVIRLCDLTASDAANCLLLACNTLAERHRLAPNHNNAITLQNHSNSSQLSLSNVPLQNSTNSTIKRRPQDLPGLPSLQRNANSHSETVAAFISTREVIPFVTPIEEPKRVVPCRYFGYAPVAQPTGVDMLNEAIDQQSRSESHEVRVSVAPSTIEIHYVNDSAIPNSNDVPIIECRVRFLSFMGVSRRDPRLCAFVVHNVNNEFVCHVFLCEPNSAILCRTIEAACTLRYQKCLDARFVCSSNGQAFCSSFTPQSLTPSTPSQRIKEGFNSVIALFGKKSR